MDNSPVIFIRYSAKLSDGGSQLSQTSWLSKYFDNSGHVIKTTEQRAQTRHYSILSRFYEH